MKGLRLIPLFLLLIILVYFGMLFVEANRQEVSITFGSYQGHSMALGFVVLTSVLVGMLISGGLCTLEFIALYIKIRGLRRKLAAKSAHHEMVSSTPRNDVTFRSDKT